MADRHRAHRVAGVTTLMAALVVLVACVGSASAAFIHKNGVSARFGTDGTEGTFISETGSLAINQSAQRLYAGASGGDETKIYGFSLPAHSPLVGNFPIEVNGSGPIAVDQASGHFYMPIFFRGIYGWDADGNPLNSAVYPIAVESHEDQRYAAVDANGNLWIADSGRGQLQEFNATTGVLIKTLNVESATEYPFVIAFDQSDNDLYVTSEQGGVWRFTAASGYSTVNTVLEPSVISASGIAIDPNSHLLYVAGRTAYPAAIPKVVAVTPTGGKVEEFQNGLGNEEQYGGIALDNQTGTLYLGDSWHSKIDVFPAQIVPTLTAAAPTGVTDSSLVANGHLDPAGGGPITKCYVEWGPTLAYGEPHVPCSQPTPISGAENVSAELTGLAPGQTYHYRFAAVNAEGKGLSADRTALTAGKPSLEGVYASEVTATGAKLHGKVDPEALETTYWFEYGPTPEYGTKIPVAGEQLAPAQEMESVNEALTGLNGGVYHFRLIAENSAGKAVSEDQTFNFYAQSCPNEILRQETGSEYLPDCRAYELVSPGAAGNVIFVPENAQPGPLASNPSRFAFGGELGGVTGTEPLNSLNVDTYVATRTSTGWTTALVGLKGSEVLGASLTLGDQRFDEFMDFYSGGGFEGVKQPGHNLPYVWGPDGSFRGRWPLTQPLIPGAEETIGTYQPSPDFSHLAFTSINVAFAPNGLVESPGSAYDYDTEAGSTSLISLLPGGEHLDIPEPPGTEGLNQYIHFPSSKLPLDGYLEWATAKIHPSVSTNGSHILMAASAGKWPLFSSELPEPPTYLYMRVSDAVTYEIGLDESGEDHPVDYVGMTADGKKVFFTTNAQLTGEDTDHNVDLYMWNEANGGEITLVSRGGPGTGNEEECNASWISGCDAMPVAGAYETDNAIAEESGDIYFYSPEVLDGTNGTRGEQNLYRYHDGTVTFVASFSKHEDYCPAEHCSNGPVGRIQISPDGTHVAFLTSNQLTSYNNNEFQEMYTYDPSTGRINCVSCMPNGEPPTGDTSGSLQGIFMTNDGRTFFYSPDPLTPKDTNEVEDVYEFVNGRPQLITTGTNSVNTQSSNFHTRTSGLEGVSANGVDVYFSTYDTLVGQDQNGQYLKFYDARNGGGFSYVPPPAPCEAADECHGEGSSPPSPNGILSKDDLGAGDNVPPATGKKKGKKKAQRKGRKKKNHAGARRKHSQGHGAKHHA